MENKLTLLSDYAVDLEDSVVIDSKTAAYAFSKTMQYVKFLKSRLAKTYLVNGVQAHPLNRFVPTDLDGNILAEPIDCGGCDSVTEPIKDNCGNCYATDYTLIFQQAKERVIFDGCTYDQELEIVTFNGFDLCYPCSWDNQTIEDLLGDLIELQVPLTKTGKFITGK